MRRLADVVRRHELVGEVFDHYEQLSQSGNLNPGQSFQSLAALIKQYAAAGFHNEHNTGQITPVLDKQGQHEDITFLSNPFDETIPMVSEVDKGQGPWVPGEELLRST
jgi:hypothetical protein